MPIKKLNIRDFEHFKSNKMVVFKPETVDGKAVIILTYMVSDSHLWTLPMALELRGHTFDAETGDIISVAFEKFFNIGENQWTQLNLLDFKEAMFFEKVDASMLNVAVINGKIFLKTKKSFYSEVAQSAMTCVTDNINKLALSVYKMGYSLIMEYYHPDWKVVLNYGKTAKFTVLAARSLHDLSYMDYDKLKTMCDDFGVDIVQKHQDMTIDIALEQFQTEKNREGYVILLKSGIRVKQKFSWYRINHRIQTELRVRDVALMVAMETIDDAKSRLSSEGYDLTQIENIETKVARELSALQYEIDLVAAQLVGLSPSHAAALVKKHKLRGLIMNKYHGKRVELIEYWRRHYLKTYSISSVYNSKW